MIWDNYRAALLELYAVAYRLKDERVLNLCAGGLRTLRDDARKRARCKAHKIF